MGDELKELAALALRNAFWHDFSALVNKYLEASEGLEVDKQEMLMGEMTSVYGRDTTATSNGVALIVEAGAYGLFGSYSTLYEALNDPDNSEVLLRGVKVFERRNGEWYFVAQYGENQNA